MLAAKKKRKSILIAVILLSVTLIALALSQVIIKPSEACKNTLRSDINCDLQVDIFDLSILLSSYSKRGAYGADLNKNGTVEVFDLSRLLSDYGQHGSPTAPRFNVIVVGLRTDQEAGYAKLDQNNVFYSLRSVAFDKNDATIKRWERSYQPYYYTAASSDFIQFQGKPMYNTASDVEEVLGRSYSQGIYMHEIVTYNAAVGGWNWDGAVSAIDWNRIEQYVNSARNHHKKVIWSEPAEAWPTMAVRPDVRERLARWSDVLVPMFATNFESPSAGHHMAAARDGAIRASREFNMPLGESVQSWYFAEQGLPTDTSAVLNLCRYGGDSGATYFQIEGTFADMASDSSYMGGIYAYVNMLSNL